MTTFDYMAAGGAVFIAGLWLALYVSGMKKENSRKR